MMLPLASDLDRHHNWCALQSDHKFEDRGSTTMTTHGLVPHQLVIYLCWLDEFPVCRRHYPRWFRTLVLWRRHRFPHVRGDSQAMFHDVPWASMSSSPQIIWIERCAKSSAAIHLWLYVDSSRMNDQRKGTTHRDTPSSKPVCPP